MAFSDSLVDIIHDKVLLSDIISKTVNLSKKGSDFIGLCPFHNEKTPSFTVSNDKGFYHCFGCGKNGDIFNYIMETENITFVEALKKLANHAGINYKNHLFNENPKLKIHLNLLKRVSDSYTKNLNAPIGKNARDYLDKRGINKFLIDHFKIGYSGNVKSNNYLI